MDKSLLAEISDDILDVYHFPPIAQPPQSTIIAACVDTIRLIFLIFIPISAVCFLTSLILPEFELNRQTDGTPTRKPSSLNVLRLIRRLRGDGAPTNDTSDNAAAETKA